MGKIEVKKNNNVRTERNQVILGTLLIKTIIFLKTT